MRWFTDAAYDADDDATWDRMLAGYTSHLSALAPSLPADLAALATEPRLHLHDARFREVRVDTDAEEVGIIFLTGGLDVGYRQLTLAFGGAAIVPDNLLLLADAVGAEFRANHWHQRRTVTEIRAQEIDLLPDGRWILRLRLWPFNEFAVAFGSLVLTEVTIDERSPIRAGRFVLGPRSSRAAADVR